MLAYTKKGTECSVDVIHDCVPNENGAYCMIYRYIDGEAEQDMFDDFCIHPEDCPDGIFESWGGLTDEAEAFIDQYMNSITEY